MQSITLSSFQDNMKNLMRLSSFHVFDLDRLSFPIERSIELLSYYLYPKMFSYTQRSNDNEYDKDQVQSSNVNREFNFITSFMKEQQDFNDHNGLWDDENSLQLLYDVLYKVWRKKNVKPIQLEP
jgi:hypothetical protein